MMARSAVHNASCAKLESHLTCFCGLYFRNWPNATNVCIENHILLLTSRYPQPYIIINQTKRVCCQRNQVHAGAAMARCKNVTAMLSSVCATIKTTDAEQAIPESLNRNEVRADAYPPTTSKNQVRSNGKRATTQQPTLPDETSNNLFL